MEFFITRAARRLPLLITHFIHICDGGVKSPRGDGAEDRCVGRRWEERGRNDGEKKSFDKVCDASLYSYDEIIVL